VGEVANPNRENRLVRYTVLISGATAFFGAVCIHLATYFGLRLLPEGWEKALAGLAVALWIMAVLALKGVGQIRNNGSWLQLGVLGAPAWLRYALLAILCYAVVNFVVVALRMHYETGDAEKALLRLRLWSGHVLFMYLAPVAAAASGQGGGSDMEDNSPALNGKEGARRRGR
jgi:hypothetical protein